MGRATLVLTAFAVLGAFSLSCRTFTPVSRVYASWPLPSVIDKAQEALKEGKLSRAAVLLLNSTEASPQKIQVQDELVTALTKKKTLEDSRTAALFTGDPLQSFQKTENMAQPSWPPVPSAELTGAGGPEKWLKGTATVMVNRGLRFVNGAAMPDIVLGSGFFITKDGYLLTNHHVIDSLVDPKYKGYAKLTIKLPNSRGESLPARVVSWDLNHDLALLKVEYHPPYVFQFAPNSNLIPGQQVTALGSPGGLDATVTQGIVSATKRPLLPMGDVIQVDVPVNPGNSGGPLVNEKGQVVGIIFAGIQQFQGVNFAIPGEVIKKVLPLLKASQGEISVPWIGAGVNEDMRGLEVSYVLPESPADWAGLKFGDRILKFAGVSVNDISTIQSLVLSYGLDSVIPLEISRQGKIKTLWCTFQKRPDYPLKKAVETDLTANILPLAFGFSVDDVGTPVDQNFRVVSVFAGSAGDQLGLSPGDPVIVKQAVLDERDKAYVVMLDIKKKLGGYLESMIQLGAPLTGRQMI